MRNPNRLDNFYEELKKLHKKYFPDWRFGQTFINFFGWLFSIKHKDAFFPEEPDMLKLFKEYIVDLTNDTSPLE